MVRQLILNQFIVSSILTWPTMRICDLPQSAIIVGLRIRGLNNKDRLGTISKIDKDDDDYAWIKWDCDPAAHSGFYGNNCECEVVGLDKQELEALIARLEL